MSGWFTSPAGDYIVIKKKGYVHWSRAGDPRDELRLVGVGSVDSQDPHLLRLTVYSASPFLGSSVAFSPDYQKITLDWGVNRADAAKGRSKEFTKTPTDCRERKDAERERRTN
jgi:hypothetical protein